jgi:hypothetical protein
MRRILTLAALLLGMTFSSCSNNPDVLRESSAIQSSANEPSASSNVLSSRAINLCNLQPCIWGQLGSSLLPTTSSLAVNSVIMRSSPTGKLFVAISETSPNFSGLQYRVTVSTWNGSSWITLGGTRIFQLRSYSDAPMDMVLDASENPVIALRKGLPAVGYTSPVVVQRWTIKGWQQVGPSISGSETNPLLKEPSQVLTLDKAGNPVVAWGVNGTIRASRWLPATSAWDTSASVNGFKPRIGVNQDNVIVLGYLVPKTQYGANILVSRYIKATSSWQSLGQVTTALVPWSPTYGVLSSQQSHDLKMDQNGNPVVAFLDNTIPINGGQTAFVIKRWTAATGFTTVGAAFGSNISDGGVSLALAANGQMIVSGFFVYDSVAAYRYDPVSNAWTMLPGRINREIHLDGDVSGLSDVLLHSVAIEPDGDPIIAWLQRKQSNPLAGTFAYSVLVSNRVPELKVIGGTKIQVRP